MFNHYYPNIAVGVVVDDRIILGTFEDVTGAVKFISDFDYLAGQINNILKMEAIATTAPLRRRLKRHNFGTTTNPIYITSQRFIKSVGFGITARLTPHASQLTSVP